MFLCPHRLLRKLVKMYASAKRHTLRLKRKKVKEKLNPFLCTNSVEVSIMVSADIVSLYCSISHDAGLEDLTLIWVVVGGNFTPRPCWFSLNNSEMVTALTLQRSVTLEAFVILNLLQSPDTVQDLDGGISGFLVNPL